MDVKRAKKKFFFNKKLKKKKTKQIKGWFSLDHKGIYHMGIEKFLNSFREQLG